MNEILIILEHIQSQIGGELEYVEPYNVLQILLKNDRVYVEIRDKTETPQIWVWTMQVARHNPSLVIDLSSPKAIEKVVKHVKDYLQTAQIK